MLKQWNFWQASLVAFMIFAAAVVTVSSVGASHGRCVAPPQVQIALDRVPGTKEITSSDPVFIAHLEEWLTTFVDSPASDIGPTDTVIITQTTDGRPFLTPAGPAGVIIIRFNEGCRTHWQTTLALGRWRQFKLDPDV